MCMLAAVQSLVRDQLLLDPVLHESAQQQGSLLVAYSVAANQVRCTFSMPNLTATKTLCCLHLFFRKWDAALDDDGTSQNMHVSPAARAV